MSQATRERDAILGNLERGQIRKTGSTDQSKRVRRDMEFFQKGVNLGAELMKARIHNSVAGLDYGSAYYVPPVVDVGVGGSTVLADRDGDAAVSGPVADSGRDSGNPIPPSSESDSLPA